MSIIGRDHKMKRFYVLLIILMLTFGCAGSGGDQAGTDVIDSTATDTATATATDSATDSVTDSDSASDTASETTVDNGYPDQGVNPEAWDWNLPDAKAVFVNTTQPEPIADAPYKIDRLMIYVIDGPADAKDVHSLAEIDGKIYAGTKDGVYVMTGQKWLKKPLTGDGGSGTVSAITKNPFDNGLCVARDNTVFCENTDKALSLPQDESILRLAATDDRIWVVSTKALYSWDGGPTPTAISDIQGMPKDVAVLSNGLIAVATDKGVWIDKSGVWKGMQAAQLPDLDCRSVAVNGDKLVVGCNTGIAKGTITDGGQFTGQDWKVYKAGIDGLAGDNIHDVSIHGDTITIAYAFGGGAVIGDMAHQDYYVSLRWLPSNNVRAVLSASDGRRYYATDKGISIIYMKTNTIAKKADWTHQDLDGHFWRMGFVAPEMYVHSDGSEHMRDSDNDGLWTQMMIGGFCYAYAVTKDEKYKTWARKALETMFLQVDIPAISFKAKGMKRGFVTRSLCREDEECFADKAGQDNWHLVTYKGKKYYWKDDTSSDETDGHFFGYPLYYDLCANTPQEKAEVADHALAISSYILDNGYKLIDLDGKETTWGHWQPDRLACALDGLNTCLKNGYSIDWCVSSAHGGGWLNSIEIMGMMLASYHMSGDPKYFNAFKDLVLKDRYWKLAMVTDETWSVTKPPVKNHSDHELAILAYHTLLRYDTDPSHREWWLKSIRRFYQYEKPEHNPLWAGIFAMFAPGEADQANAVQSMREMPVMNRRLMLVDNSHRKDAKIIGIDRGGDKEFDRVFPFDEIRTMWWNGNPYNVTYGGNNQEIRGPMAFLLAYWTLRYSGVLK